MYFLLYMNCVKFINIFYCFTLKQKAKKPTTKKYICIHIYVFAKGFALNENFIIPINKTTENNKKRKVNKNIFYGLILYFIFILCIHVIKFQYIYSSSIFMVVSI